MSKEEYEINEEAKAAKQEQEAAETAHEAAAQAEEPKEEGSLKRKCKDKKEDASKKQIAELTDKLAKEKDNYMRLMAEFETFRRRSSEEKLSLVASAAADTIKGFLPVLDDLDAALKVLRNADDKSSLEGIELIYNKLMDYLKSCGLEVIDAVGKDFDTDFHEALTQVPGAPEMKGKVIEVFKSGYTFKGKVLRFAKVVVGC